MSPDDFERAISEARGYAEIGLWQDAWECLENLPPSDRALPAALAVRLSVCAGLHRWEMGTEIVRLFSPGLPLDLREAAGRYHLAHAESLCAAGSIASAKEAVRELSIVWPEGRELALDAKALAAIW
jgi:hypothetical protein